MFFKYSNLKNLTRIYKLAKKKHYLKKNIQQFFKDKYNRSDTIKIAYDTQSGDYINYFKKLSKKTINQVYFPIIETINNNFKTSKTILDFGCASGNFYKIFKSLYGKINYMGIDFDPLMIKSARKIHSRNKIFVKKQFMILTNIV